jgi:hypothetical protein
MTIPLPDFWIAYFFIFWVLAGITATPPVLRHKGYPFLLGVVAGVIVGVASGGVFMLLLAIANPVIDAVGSTIIATLVAIGVASGAIIAGLGALKNLIPGSGGTPSAENRSEGAPRTAVAYSTRVDKVHPSWQATQSIRASAVIMLAALTLIPVVWMGMTAFKSRSDAVASPPKVIFEPTMEGFISLLYDRRQLNEQQAEEYRQRDDLDWKD